MTQVRRGLQDAGAGKDAAWVLLWTLAGLALRALLIGFTNRVSGDGVGWYLPMARAFFDGRWSDGFDATIPFVYSLCVAGVAHLLPAAAWRGPLADAGAFELAGQITSSLFGAATVPIVYLLLRRFAPPPQERAAARIGAAMAALSPFLARYGAQVLTEATYTFFFLLALLAGGALLRRRSAASAALFGLAVGAACLNRPEAMGLLIVIGGWVALPALRRPRALAGAAGLGAVVLLFFLIGLFPQMAITHADTGVWTLSAKREAIFKKSHLKDELASERWRYPAPEEKGKGGQRTAAEGKTSGGKASEDFTMARFLRRHPVAFARDYATVLAKFVSHVPAAMGGVLTFFMVIGLAARREIPRGRGEAVVGSVLLAYLLMLSLFHFSLRFLAPLAPLGILWSSLGLLEAAARVGRASPAKWAARLPAAARRRPMRAILVAALCALLLEAVLTNLAENHFRWYWSPEKRAGAWMRANLPPGVKLMTRSSMIEAYYAGARVAYFPFAPYDEVMDYIRRTQVRYVLFDEDKTARLRPGFIEAFTAGGGRMIRDFDYGRKKVYLYEVIPPRGTAGAGAPSGARSG